MAFQIVSRATRSQSTFACLLPPRLLCIAVQTWTCRAGRVYVRVRRSSYCSHTKLDGLKGGRKRRIFVRLPLTFCRCRRRGIGAFQKSLKIAHPICFRFLLSRHGKTSLAEKVPREFFLRPVSLHWSRVLCTRRKRGGKVDGSARACEKVCCSKRCLSPRQGERVILVYGIVVRNGPH